MILSLTKPVSVLSQALDMAAKTITIKFNPMTADNYTYTNRRLRVDKIAAVRPGASFAVKGAGAKVRPSNSSLSTASKQTVTNAVLLNTYEYL